MILLSASGWSSYALQTPPPETQLSLKEIYRSKQKAALKCTDWDGSQSSGPLSPQVGHKLMCTVLYCESIKVLDPDYLTVWVWQGHNSPIYV